uniref:Uncharacterized protein n=1 Tax=Scophthalmus maximus TaxID=52904 RepID=A0A8D3C679_SCOMX
SVVLGKSAGVAAPSGRSWNHQDRRRVSVAVVQVKRRRSEVRGQTWSWSLEKEPSCLVLTSLSCSSCLCPRRYRYSMYITSVLLMQAFSRNSSRIRGTKPGLSRPARRKWRYRARTCFCSLL